MYIQLPLISWHSWPVNGHVVRLDPALLVTELASEEVASDELVMLLELP